VLIREGFSFGALLFGPFWLAVHRAWLAAAVALLLDVAILVLTDPPASTVLAGALALLLGYSGRDLGRWSLTHRGYQETNVVTGGNEDEARYKLFAARPDLVDREMVAETAP
jgi:hypothetical protein